MMTSWNGNIFRVTGPLCGEFTGHQWIPVTKPVTRSFDVCFDPQLHKQLNKQSWDWWFKTPSRLLWRHCTVVPIICCCDCHTYMNASLCRLVVMVRSINKTISCITWSVPLKLGQCHRDCKSGRHILWHGTSSLWCCWHASKLDRD